MASPDFGELRRVRIDPELLSRGSGERVSLHDAVVFDFMPPILGNRFRTDEALRRAIHFYGGGGSFMMNEEAYMELAGQELAAGNLVPALEAYKRGLHNAVGFVGAIADLGDDGLLSPQETDRFHLNDRFGPLERKLISTIIGTNGDTKINLTEYAGWLGGIRRLTRESLQLGSQFHWAVRKHPENKDMDPRHPDYWDNSLVGNSEIGRKLLVAYIQMEQYGLAARVAEKLGDTEGVAEYTELAKTDPEENQNFRPIFWKIQDSYGV